LTKIVAKRIDIPIDKIRPSPFQPRRNFNLEDIKGSIKRDGILMALIVREKEDYYELIDGERRLRAAKELGFKAVPCDVVEADDDAARRMVWKINTHRNDYTLKEKALFFRRMREEHGMSLRGIAKEYDQDHHTVKAYLNVLKLPDDYQQMVWDRVIPIGVIRELEPLFTRGVYSPEGELLPEENPQIFEMLDKAATRVLGQREIREAVRAPNRMNASEQRTVTPRIRRLLELLKPPKKKLLRVNRYGNSDRLHVIFEPPLCEGVPEVLEEIARGAGTNMTLDAFLQNIVERPMSALKNLKPDEAEMLVQVLKQNEEPNKIKTKNISNNPNTTA